MENAPEANIFCEQAKEWLADHPERRDPLLQDLTAALFERADKLATAAKAMAPA